MFPLQFLKNNKFVSAIMIVLLITTLSGCSGLKRGEPGRVKVPMNKAISIAGKWQITSNEGKKESKYLYNYVQFSNKGVLFGNDFFGNPNYKIKMVNAEEYFLYHLGIDNVQYKSNDGLIEVITITCGNKYLYEFAVISDYKLIAKVEDKVIYLKKVSSKIDENTFNAAAKTKNSSVEALIDSNNKKQDSGILLGIKYIKGSEYNGTYIYGYKTLWISYKNNKPFEILEMDNLLLPRKNGFYMVSSDTKESINNYEDVINVTNLSDTKETNNKKGSPDDINTKLVDKNHVVKNNDVIKQNISRSILFAGNDYISLNVTKGNKADSDYDSRLILEPIDNFSDSNGVKISDVCGEDGLRRMQEARDTAVTDGNSIIEQSDSTNFGLVRRAGHWFVVGRLSYENETEKKFKDYNINVMTPSKVIFYDTLFVPWTNVKDKIPDANDIFTSPNDNMAVVITPNKFLVYGINGIELEQNPKYKIDMRDYDSVVMAEWCTGSYVQYWEKAFKKQKFDVVYRNTDK